MRYVVYRKFSATQDNEPNLEPTANSFDFGGVTGVTFFMPIKKRLVVCLQSFYIYHDLGCKSGVSKLRPVVRVLLTHNIIVHFNS